jgi:tetratricopeptide (TPR) repeat protein
MQKHNSLTCIILYYIFYTKKFLLRKKMQCKNVKIFKILFQVFSHQNKCVCAEPKTLHFKSMNNTQSQIALERLPMIRAAAFKNFDVRVVDMKTGQEKPFDLMTTQPGCYINVLFKDPGIAKDHSQSVDPTTMKVSDIKKELEELDAGDQIVQGMEKSELVQLLLDARSKAEYVSPSGGLKNFKRGARGVREFKRIRYIDSPSLAYELYSLSISEMHRGDARERQFQRDRILLGNWAYIAVLPEQNAGDDECGELAFFWSLVLHYHRYGECLPACDPNLTEDEICFNQEKKKIVNMLNPKSAEAGRIFVQSRWMSALMMMERLISGATAFAKSGKQAPQNPDELPQNNVDFVAPVVKEFLPKWWVLFNHLWTVPFEKFIKSGGKASSLPCMFHLKQSGCQERRYCSFDHNDYVPLIQEIRELQKKPFDEQDKPLDESEATRFKVFAFGQGVDFNAGEFENCATKEERQLQIKNKGNEYFTQQDFRTAIKFYNEAINTDPDAVEAAAIYSNRSLCNMNIHETKKALSDAEKCISLKPKWFRGYCRKGAALLALNRLQEASEAYDQALKCEGVDDATKQTILEMKEQCNQAKNSENKQDSATAFAPTDKSASPAAASSYTGKDTVTAVLFPADPNRRPYEIQIPAKIVDNAQVIHDLLKITSAQVKSLPAFLRAQPVNYPAGFPVDASFEYSMKDWLNDHQQLLDKNDGTLGYGFQPKELVRGDNNKSNLLCLINPQSTGPVNRRVCAMLTQMDGSMNMTDLSPRTAKCRGDALVIRFKPNPQDANLPYFKDKKLMYVSKTSDALNTYLKKAQTRFNDWCEGRNGTPQEIDEARRRKFRIQTTIGSPAAFIEIATFMNDVVLEQDLLNFTYDEYDKVWGLFTYIEIPGQDKAATTLLPNTPQYEKQLAETMSKAMGSSGRGRGRR